MGFLPLVTDIVDINGNSIAKLRSDGTRAPMRIKLGSGLTAISTPNGGIDDVELVVSGAATADVNPTPNTLLLRDGSGGAKAAYVDSGAASDLLLKRNGVLKLTVASALVTASVGVVAPTFAASTGITTPYVDSGANADLLVKRNGATILSVTTTGLSWIDGIVPSINQQQSSTGVGAKFAIRAAQGKTGNAGGPLYLGGGPKGAGATILAGDTQITLGDCNDSLLSAKLSVLTTVLGVESSILDVYQPQASVVELTANRDTFFINQPTVATGAIKLSLNHTSLLTIDFATVNRITMGTSSSKIGFFNSAGVTQRTMTDSTTGAAAAALVAVTSNADSNNNFATIARLLQEIGLAHV